MTDPWWSVVQGWVIFGSVAMLCLTFLLTVVLTQRHYRAIQRLRNDVRLREAEVEIAELTEKQVNGRSADDVIDMAKAIERQAKAEDKLATAVERRILAQANVKELPEPDSHAEAARGRAEYP
jgi:uncharacterized membrane protein YcjF (UPF0283 family)